MNNELQMGRLVEAVDTLKKNDEHIYRALNNISLEQAKQTALIAQFLQGMQENKTSIKEQDERVKDLENSRARAYGAASVIGFVSGIVSSILGKHL